jgi:hypothetical protein
MAQKPLDLLALVCIVREVLGHGAAINSMAHSIEKPRISPVTVQQFTRRDFPGHRTASEKIA